MEILNSAQAHSLSQTSMLIECRTKNAILNDLISQHNKRVRELKDPWWKIW